MNDAAATSWRRAGTRAGRRLRTRVVLQLVGLAAVVCGGMAWGAFLLVERTYEHQLAGRLEQRLRAVEALLQRDAGRVSLSLSGLAHYLRRSEPTLLEDWLSGDTFREDDVERLTRLGGLTFLEVVDDGGTVLASGLWPERAGLRDSLFHELPEGETVLRRIDGPRWSGLAQVGGHALTVGRRRLLLIGGIALDRSFVESVAAGGAAGRSDPAGAAPIVVGADRELLRASAAAPVDRPATVLAVDGSRWVVGRFGRV